MTRGLLHIYRNNPYGRETLLSSIYFSKVLNIDLNIYIPSYKKFNMYFEHKALQITLDSSYLSHQKHTKKNLKNILEKEKVEANIIEYTEFSASSLPDLPTDFTYMTCPRSISSLLNKIYPGQIGPIVRDLIVNSKFPIFLPSIIFKPWKSIVVLFNGDDESVKGLELGLELKRETKFPLYLFTHAEKDKSWYETKLTSYKIGTKILGMINEWLFLNNKDLESNLFAIPHNALVIAGIFKKNILKGIAFGSKLELIQSTLPNNFLFVGPNYSSEHI